MRAFGVLTSIEHDPLSRVTRFHERDGTATDALAIQDTSIEEGLRCLVVRCPRSSLVCRETAQLAWADLIKEAEGF
jgi:hypothetical protein